MLDEVLFSMELTFHEGNLGITIICAVKNCGDI